MLFSLCTPTVFAETLPQYSGQSVTGAGGLCEHHPEHNADCGYTEGTTGTPCVHEHTADCYEEVTNCVHEHDEDCYPEESVSGNEATPSGAQKREPENCPHICDEKSGCIAKELNCQHEHDDECGYSPATAGTPCGYVCELCGAGDNTPSNAKAVTVASVQAMIDALPNAEEITEDNAEDVKAQLDAIDEAKEKLSDEEIDELDFTRYAEAAAALGALAAPMLLADDSPDEQFSLKPGDTYYFDLSAMGIPGTANSGNSDGAAPLPDMSLHYVPFTYVGTINAYSRNSEGVSTDDTVKPYAHSLFVADYNVTHTVSWDDLNTASLIFGKSYVAGGVDYTLRAPSAGSDRTGSGDSKRIVPQSNEWDTMLNKNSGYIQNWNGIISWGQDTSSDNASCRAGRGYYSARSWNYYNATDSNPYVGFRPVLEVLNPDTLGSDGLKAVTLDLGGGKLGGSTDTIQIIVKTGSTFTAPASDGLTRPDGDTGSYFVWLGSNGKLYAPGDNVPADVTKLTAQFTLSEQFSLTSGGRYYFDLSGANIPGTANGSLPDSTLHYVPFTYAGTVDAYKLMSATATTEEYAQQNKYAHSLFVADYNVTHTVSWDDLNTASLIFGKNYASGGVGYTLRAPSAGSNSTGTGDSDPGVPQSNEWDTMLNKDDEYIQNWNEMLSWGQDTSSSNASYRAVRGCYSARFWSNSNAAGSSPFVGFRPVLEVLNPDTLNSDGLKVVTLDLGGGTLGGSSDAIQIIVKNGSTFTAPASDSLTRPDGDTGSFFMWLGSNGKLYAPGASVPADVIELTAQFALSEQFSLTPGGRYYFDLSGASIPGTVNTGNEDGAVSLPDTTLHYVPFTYAGTVNAYSRNSEGVSTDDTVKPYAHSLFVADYAVTHAVSWNDLNTASLIFGKNYASGGVDYTLRAPSAGSNSTGSGDSDPGVPQSNEWDTMLNKNSRYIQNWNKMYSWGQDTFSDYASYRAIRGYTSARFWYNFNASFSYPSLGFRPVLEVLNPDTLGSDGLKVVTLDLGGGKLGNSSEDIQIIVKNGSTFTAPASDGMTRPDGDSGNYFMWLDGNGNFYKPGDSVPADVTKLTVQWTAPAYTVTLNTNGGTIADGKNVTSYTYGVDTTLPTANDMTYTGHTFKGWYDNDGLTGDPVTEISKTETGNKEYWAKWTINRYTITFDTAGGSEIAPITQDYGSTIAAPAAPTKTGYTFTGWSPALPATMPAGDLTVKAQWTAKQYTITFDTDGGSEVAPITQDYGTAITAPANPTRDGYTFTGWNPEIPATMPAGDLTVKAQWTINQYTITFDTDGGSTIDPITQDYGTDITAPVAPTKTGYTFMGWDKEIPTTMPAEDLTVKAQWTINQYTITFDTDGGSESAPIKQDYGTDITAPEAPTKSGYTFMGWDKEIPTTMPAGDLTVKAKWTINQYTITFDTDGGSEIVPIKQDYGTDITAPADPTREGYTFTGWDKAIPATMPAENVTITAQWTVNQYTVTLNTNGGTINSGNITSYTYGVGATLPTADDMTYAGHTFKGWYEDSSFSDSPVTEISTTATGAKTYYAKWLSTDAGITAVSVDNTAGTINGTTITVVLPYGTVALPTENSKVSITAADGATVSDLTTTDGSEWTFTVTAADGQTTKNYTISVSIAPDPATGNKSDIAAAKSTVENHDWTVPQATANTEEAVKTWIEGQLAAMNLNGASYTVTMTGFTAATEGTAADRDGTNGSFTFTVKLYKGNDTGNIATSTYAEATVTISNGTVTATPYTKWTVTVNAGNGGSVSGGGTFEENTQVTVTATPNSGYHFVRWTENGAEVSTSASYSFTLTADRTLTAVFSRNSSGGYSCYTIEATAGAGGSISPSGNVSVREGRDQTFTITPDKGYAVANVKIDGKSIGAVKSYTFENVRRTHTIEVIFMKANGNPQTGVFVDVATGSYYEDAVDWAVENGITKGTDDTHFSPDGICTRAQAVTFLWRTAGSPASKTSTMPFTDVPVGSYYYDAVLWAVENGITKGTSDTTFSPNMTCSRAQIVTFLWRSEKSPAAGTANPFADVKSTAYYADAVLWAVKENITKGTTSTTFSPNADCTRAQIVTFLWRCKK